MKILNSEQLTTVAGGQWIAWPPQPIHYAMLGSGLLAGTCASCLSGPLASLTTLLGTIGLSTAAVVACQPHILPPQQYACGLAGALGGYLFSQAVIQTTLAVIGFGLGAGATYYYVSQH